MDPSGAGSTDAPVRADRVGAAVSAYARRVHAAAGGGQHVVSPLGAWLLLGLLAAPATGAVAGQLSDVLGLPAREAAAAAYRLLDTAPAQLGVAAAVWNASAMEPMPDRGRAWLAGLPERVERGPVPAQEQADRWARDRTLGLIDRFPLSMTPDTVGVLATVLAARVRWRAPFDVAPATELRSPWRHQVGEVLRTPAGPGHRTRIVTHPELGELAVHRADADGLAVVSVIGPVDAAPLDVLAAAYDAAAGRLADRSLFDLPVGDGPAWTITETEGVAGRERLEAVLPAWSVTTRLELGRHPRLGFGAAAELFGGLLGVRGGVWDAAQAATARYDRRGFEAAAVTALAVRATAVLRRPGRERAALVRFDRPFAVVAIAGGHGVWDGLPVFGGWITEPGPIGDDQR